MKSHKFPAHDRAVREPERREITGVPTSGWYALMAAGLAPKPFRIGTRIVAWSLNELNEWVEAQKAKRGETWHPLGEVAACVIEKSRREK
jgi:predicted DNA-binding transcriptional regulator AlpA